MLQLRAREHQQGKSRDVPGTTCAKELLTRGHGWDTPAFPSSPSASSPAAPWQPAQLGECRGQSLPWAWPGAPGHQSCSCCSRERAAKAACGTERGQASRAESSCLGRCPIPTVTLLCTPGHGSASPRALHARWGLAQLSCSPGSSLSPCWGDAEHGR